MARRRTLEKKRKMRNTRNKKIRRTYQKRRRMRGGNYWEGSTISFKTLAQSQENWNRHLGNLFNETDTAITNWVNAVTAKNTGAIEGLETAMNKKLQNTTEEVIKLPEGSKARQNLEWSIKQFEAQKNNFKAANP